MYTSTHQKDLFIYLSICVLNGRHISVSKSAMYKALHYGTFSNISGTKDNHSVVK